MENNIRYFRSLNNMTQSELAKRLNVSHVTVSSWEVDRTEPNMGQAIKLCEIFKCTFEELFRSSSAEYYVSNEEQELIENYRSTDETTREMVRRLLKYQEGFNEEKL